MTFEPKQTTSAVASPNNVIDDLIAKIVRDCSNELHTINTHWALASMCLAIRSMPKPNFTMRARLQKHQPDLDIIDCLQELIELRNNKTGGSFSNVQPMFLLMMCKNDPLKLAGLLLASKFNYVEPQKLYQEHHRFDTTGKHQLAIDCFVEWVAWSDPRFRSMSSHIPLASAYHSSSFYDSLRL